MLSDAIDKGCAILIPSWNNLPYLEKCISSIHRYSTIQNHEIVVHVNEGTDGTLEWVEQQGLRHTYTPQNVGVCTAMNLARADTNKEALVYFNDDMVALPEWDLKLRNFAHRYDLGIDVWLSSTMIEPRGDNPCCLAPFDYGQTLETFREQDLIKDMPSLRLRKGNVKGSTWPPNLIHAEFWDKIGGYSEEFNPGFGSDPDLAKKLYDIGVRDFVGVGDSLVYHFISKTTQGKKFIHNDGERQFLHKHGMTIAQFVSDCLQRGAVWCPRH